MNGSSPEFAPAGAGAEGMLSIRQLDIEYESVSAVDSVNLTVHRGEVLGLVGESGCGKSTLATATLGFLRGSGRRTAGRILLEGRNLFDLRPKELQEMRGAHVALVPQNPGRALAPHRRIHRQLRDVLRAHGYREADIGKRIDELLRAVELPEPETIAKRFPHELSGGQQQRACIAVALAMSPELLVLDEPTTNLDATTQSQILDLLHRLRRRGGLSMLYVTHDLALISGFADCIAVMYAGRIVELGRAPDVLGNPEHPYTQGLVASVPRMDDEGGGTDALKGSLRRSDLPRGCPFAPRCPHSEQACREQRQELLPIGDGHLVACRRAPVPAPAVSPPRSIRGPARGSPEELLEIERLTVRYGRGAFRTPAPPAVDDLSLSIAEGEVVALVGESGSGKSTLARAIAGTVIPSGGVIRFGGSMLPPRLVARSRDVARAIGFVFQNPDESLNPRQSVRRALCRPAMRLSGLDRAGANLRAEVVLESVRLDASYQDRYPDQLSGGERQRVAIARALVPDPRLLVCDEVLSALDVSVQAGILTLLEQLKREAGITMLFISHDLAVVRRIADRVVVLQNGRIVEVAAKSDLYANPKHDYTRRLLAASPVISADGRSIHRGTDRSPDLEDPGRN